MRKGKFTRVRYLRISRMSLEIVNGLTEQAKAEFLDQCLRWFYQLENREEIEMVDTDNHLLNLALREEIAELQEGFATYMRSVKAKSESKTTADVPLMDLEQIADVPPIYPSEETKSLGNYMKPDYGTVNQKVIDEAQRLEIELRLNDLGIESADPGFWNTCFAHGYDRVDAALSRAESTGNGNIKFITGMIANGI